MSSTVQATQSLTVNNATTVSTLVQSLNNLVGNNTAACSSQQSNLAYVAPGISTEVPSTVMSALPKAIVIGNNQPLILPKPNMQKTIMPSTPPKVAYISSHSLLNSPIHGHASPGQTLLVTSPFQRKRPFGDNDTEATDSKKRRTPSRCTSEKTGKGLRHFSMKVCEKVQLKGVTTYNEVADELVQDFAESSKNADGTEHTYDQKNIRRRVYDALNVLKAMNIITNEKKEIRWVGLPTNSAQECRQLEEQKAERTERIQQKMQQLKELLVQQIAFKNLVERNKQTEKKNGPPPQNACIDLPFIIVNTSKKTVIDCSISNDKAEYLFNFNEAFEIHDDIEVLKRMGLSFGLDKGECTPKNLIAARKMVPRSLEPYVQQMADGTFGHVEIIDRNSILTVPLDTINSRQCTSRSKDQLLSSYKSTTSSRRTFPTISDDSENDAEDERSIAE